LSETPEDVWESDDCVRRTVVLPNELAERLAAEAERRGRSVSDLLIEYADEGLGREGAEG
jgi:predicted DNA-binding protein